MAFERLDSVVKRVVGRIANEVGDGDGCNRPDAVNLAKSRKNAGTEAPASWEEVVSRDTALPVQEDHTSKERRIAPASPKAGKGSPSPAVRRSLFVVVEGGRLALEGGVSRAAYAQPRGGNRRSKLVLVSG